MNKKLALAIVAVVLAASLAANAYLYTDRSLRTQIIDLQNQLEAAQFHAQSLETEKADLKNQTAVLTIQVADLQKRLVNQNGTNQSEISRLTNENIDLQRTNTDLQNQLYEKGPRLITKLGATDVRIDPNVPKSKSTQTRLFIEGVVWNIGSQTANNCRLHVMLLQNDEVVNNTYIILGAINTLDCANVRTDVYYNTGGRLTSWKIIPEFT